MASAQMRDLGVHQRHKMYGSEVVHDNAAERNTQLSMRPFCETTRIKYVSELHLSVCLSDDNKQCTFKVQVYRE